MNILVTNFENSNEDVMIFTEKEHITPTWVEKNLKQQGKQYEEIYEVKDNELQYYIYDACWV